MNTKPVSDPADDLHELVASSSFHPTIWLSSLRKPLLLRLQVYYIYSTPCFESSLIWVDFSCSIWNHSDYLVLIEIYFHWKNTFASFQEYSLSHYILASAGNSSTVWPDGHLLLASGPPSGNREHYLHYYSRPIYLALTHWTRSANSPWTIDFDGAAFICGQGLQLIL